jgi:hypothetical protein
MTPRGGDEEARPGDAGRDDGGSRSWGRVARIGLVVAIGLELLVLLHGGAFGGGSDASAESERVDAASPLVSTGGDTAVAYTACTRLVAEELRGSGTPYFPASVNQVAITGGDGGGDGLVFRIGSRAYLQLESGDNLWHAFDCTVERTPEGWRGRDVQIRRLLTP